MKAVIGGLHHQAQILLESIFSLRIPLVKTFRQRAAPPLTAALHYDIAGSAFLLQRCC